MELLFILLTQTVPVEHPYFEIVRREVEFIPLPQGIDSVSYLRALDLDYTEDSLRAVVRGLIKECWLDATTLSIEECDSFIMKGDTIRCFSHLRFEFTRLEARILCIELPLAIRIRSLETRYDVDSVLSRLGWSEIRYKVDSSSIMPLALVSSSVQACSLLVNLNTGAVIEARVRPSPE